MENNKIKFCGTIINTPTISHVVYDKKFYEFNVRITRLSGTNDILPVVVSEKMLYGAEIVEGMKINATGQLRSLNKVENGQSRLILKIFVEELSKVENTDNANIITLNGYVCKQPIYRITPFNREITEILIAVNRAHNKSDYIPCIAWGRNARFASNLLVGDRIALSGRFQSREYDKRITETEICKKIAYEVSICKIAIHNTNELLNIDKDFSSCLTKNK